MPAAFSRVRFKVSMQIGEQATKSGFYACEPPKVLPAVAICCPAAFFVMDSRDSHHANRTSVTPLVGR